jgi:hypothetical protein
MAERSLPIDVLAVPCLCVTTANVQGVARVRKNCWCSLDVRRRIIALRSVRGDLMLEQENYARWIFRMIVHVHAHEVT